jgi:threonine dehydratase
VPIGLGSGICGLISTRDALGLKTKIVGVVSEGADAYLRSLGAVSRPTAVKSRRLPEPILPYAASP